LIWGEKGVLGLGRGDMFLVLVSYGYVLALILVSGRLDGVLGLSRGTSS
jgi:hypothetical protein